MGTQRIEGVHPRHPRRAPGFEGPGLRTYEDRRSGGAGGARRRGREGGPIFRGAEGISGSEHALTGRAREDVRRRANRTAPVVGGGPECEGAEGRP